MVAQSLAEPGAVAFVVTFAEIVLEMRDRIKRFLWTWKFWAMIGVFGCLSGIVFQKLAGTGTELWCLGLCFLGAAYVERQGI